MHNIFCDNCHSHVAKCLNIMGYGGKKSFDMVKLAVWIFFTGRFVSVRAFFVTFLPFLMITAGIVFMSLYI
jgi:transmembrane protein 222